MPPKHGVLTGLDDHWEGAVESDDQQDLAKSGIVGTFLAWTRSDMSLATESRMVIQYAQWAHSRGAIPMIDLHPPANVTLADIAAGRQDSTLAVYAKALHAWNHPFLFRLFPEMNIVAQPYSPGSHGNTAAQFIAAWRHVYRLFRHYGATKVQFIWNPDKYFKSQKVSFRAMWPGASYVNWVGIDVFNFNNKSHGIYKSARVATAPSVALIRKFTTKPLMLPEIGVTNRFTKKPSWIAESLQGLAALGVKAVVWFNEDSVEDWRYDSSSTSLKAARKTLKSRSAVWPGHNGGGLTRDQNLITRHHW